MSKAVCMTGVITATNMPRLPLRAARCSCASLQKREIPRQPRGRDASHAQVESLTSARTFFGVWAFCACANTIQMCVSGTLDHNFPMPV